ncbi:MAG TPA: hypothetical protein VHB20_12125 [Verrucomicrobiae bacterium]|jgi:hypothetical protein|nr:hypothetical protein [Verrucomicrobiae bacterium]
MTESSADPSLSASMEARFAALRRYVPLLVWIMAIGTILFIPAKIIGYGYLPPDDALRHAAQGVSGKPWSEVMVLREPLKVDFQYGWDLIQRVWHRWFDAGAESLVEISIGTLFVLVSAVVLVWLRRPEAWLGALFLNCLVGNPVNRFFFGRPYLVTIAAGLFILLAWRRSGPAGPRLRDVAWIAAAIGLACYIHGTWYLWVVMVAAFFLAGQIRWSVAVGCGWLLGAVLAGVATGHPIDYLTGAVQVALRAVGNFTTQTMAATELQPALNFNPALVLGAMLMARGLIKAPWQPLRRDPAFWLAVIGWILGCGAGRFWYDWGMVGLLVVMTTDLQTLLEATIVSDSVERLLGVGALALGVYGAMTADVGGRWTATLHDQYLTESDPTLTEWLPGKGGIFYANTMRLFYQTYFKNPNAPWKYVLGFEPTLMPDDDFLVYHRIMWDYEDDHAYDSWVKKMRPIDRLAVIGAKPHIDALEWHYTRAGYWLGRLPLTNAPSLTEPKAVK